jgi:hypothetical protein
MYFIIVDFPLREQPIQMILTPPFVGSSRSKPLDSNVIPYYSMSRFNVREITVMAPPLPPTIHDKKPSAYAAMRDGPSVISHVETFAEGKEEKRGKGRPSKDEMRRKKLALASASIGVLVNSKPTKAKIEEYMRNRMDELDLEKA